MKKILLLCSALLCAGVSMAQYKWVSLPNAPTNGGKQDDIYFVTPTTGWSINGSGRIYKTSDGGNSWTKQIDKPGTYFRCVGFIDSLTGFAGNIGTAYFPGVTDTIPLYKTTDGGVNWLPVTNISGPTVKGLCAIDVVNDKVVYAAGRVGSPVHLIKSTDSGKTWTSKDMSAHCAMILDLKFFGPDTGFVFTASDASVPSSHAQVLYTTDGGQTFTTVYTSSRFNEICWKASFPSRKTGYLTILSYDPLNNNRYVAKTTDGGLTWTDLPLVNNGCKEFGIGFVSDHVGWVGSDLSGYETTDGGATWQSKNLGVYTNKIRVIPDGANFVAYAIGRNIFKLSAAKPSSINTVANSSGQIVVSPNPVNAALSIQLLDASANKEYTITVYNTLGAKIKTAPLLINGNGKGTLNVSDLAGGTYTIVVSSGTKQYTQKIQIK
ncbi:MAG: T9SS type A sorting domain-containing protein [Flavipsychrobacter sp.]